MEILASIELTRLDKNIYFVQKDIRSVYKDVFQETIDKYNQKLQRHMSNENWL